MILVSAREMREIDRRAIEELGVPGLELMEAAGRAVFAAARDMLRDPRERGVLVLAGRGNNGGDGFVVARLLAAEGARVHLFLVGEGNRLSDDARVNLERARDAGLAVREAARSEDLAGIREAAADSALVVDALFGTGLTRAVSGIAAEVIEAASTLGLPVLSVDVPSGVDSDTGAVPGAAIRATRTVTLAYPKLGLFLYPGREHAGRVEVADIGIPAGAVPSPREGRPLDLFDAEEARRALPRRRGDAHKGDAGHVLIVAGSPGFTGAATLCALGALRVGAGLVTVAVPASLNPILEVKLTEAMTVPVAESAAHTHTPRAMEEIQRALEGKRALAVGPGLSRHPEAAAAARELVARVELPMVLDADGLNAFEGDPAALAARRHPLIITPHPGELSRILGLSTREVQRDRPAAAARAASEAGCVVVLKGAPTLVADPSGEIWLNPTGNAGLASGGTGDVLTGAILGLLSQGLEPAAAARLGVYLHGLAGDLAARRMGPVGYLAGEVASALPRALRDTARPKRNGRDVRRRAR